MIINEPQICPFHHLTFMVQFDKYNPIYNPIVTQCYITQYCHKTWDIENYAINVTKPIKVTKIDCKERPCCIRPLVVLSLHYVITYLASNVITWSHYLNQCRLFVNWTPGNKFQWNSNHFHSRKCIWNCRQPFCPGGEELIWVAWHVKPNMQYPLSGYIKSLADAGLTEHHNSVRPCYVSSPLIAMFMGPTWGPSGPCGTQVGPMLSPLTLLLGKFSYPKY